MGMKKGKGLDVERAKRVFAKHLLDKGITTKKTYEPPEFKDFKKLLENKFLDKKVKNIRDEPINDFSRALAALKLSNENIFLNLVHYYSKIFWTAELRATSKPLHTSRDFALEIYAKVFSDMFRELKEPVKPGKLPIRKVDLIVFLTGIADGPYDYKSISERLALFAESDETVLITGETGTGKELHAKTIHYLSHKSKKKFVAVNCAGIPEPLLESELFGITKGAATGVEPNEGILNDVGEGTLFLDEIGDMPLALQAKVLRVLQSRQFNKVGDYKTIYTFNGRVIAATNRDLRAEIKETPPKFRPDLYYRLNVLPIPLSSFRTLSLYEKRNAILYKLRNIIHSKTGKPGNWSEMEHLSGHGGSVAVIGTDGKRREVDDPLFSEDKNPYISEEAMQLLLHYDFPGNYRELDNFIRRLYVLAGGKKIEAGLLRNELIEIKENKPQKVVIEETGETTIMVKDIIEHANKARVDIVRKHIKALHHNGQDLKKALAVEGVGSVSDYQNFRNKIETIIGKGEIGKIKKECKPKK